MKYKKIISLANERALGRSGESDYGEEYYKTRFDKTPGADGEWNPRFAKPLSDGIVNFTGITSQSRVFDFGCGRGFLMKALNIYHRVENVCGCDVSEYAVDNLDPHNSGKIRLATDDNPVPYEGPFDIIIAKDVFEHIRKEELTKILTKMRQITDRLMIIVPNAVEGKYLLDNDEADETHVIRDDIQWWISFLERHGFALDKHTHRVPGIKDHWFEVHNEGTNFFLFR